MTPRVDNCALSGEQSTAQCTLITLYNVQCVQCTLPILHTVHCTCTMHTFHTVHCTVYTVHTAHSTHCTLHSAYSKHFTLHKHKLQNIILQECFCGQECLHTWYSLHLTSAHFVSCALVTRYSWHSAHLVLCALVTRYSWHSAHLVSCGLVTRYSWHSAHCALYTLGSSHWSPKLNTASHKLKCHQLKQNLNYFKLNFTQIKFLFPSLKITSSL